jgi:hypothetical protein
VGLGSDVAGVVDEVGMGVTELQLGDENGDDKKEPSVFATAYGGGPIKYIGVLEAWRAVPTFTTPTPPSSPSSCRRQVRGVVR